MGGESLGHVCVCQLYPVQNKKQKKEQYVSLSLGNISLYKQIKEQRQEEERRVMWEKEAKSKEIVEITASKTLEKCE